MPYNSHLKRKEDIGLSPYALKFRGEKKSDEVLMRIFDIFPEKIVEKEIHTVNELVAFKDSESLTWLNIDGLHNEKLMSEVASLYGIPADILSDVMEPSTRPQVEEFENGVFISIKMLKFDEKSNKVSVDNLSLIIMEHMLLSFQEEKGDVFDPVRERIRKHKTKIRTSGKD